MSRRESSIGRCSTGCRGCSPAESAITGMVHSMGRYHARSKRRLVWVEMTHSQINREGVFWLIITLTPWIHVWASNHPYPAWISVSVIVGILSRRLWQTKTLIWRPRTRPMLKNPPRNTHTTGVYR